MTVAQSGQAQIQSESRRVVPATEVLMAWAMFADGGAFKSWRLQRSGGTPDVCEFHIRAYHHVEGFFRYSGCGRFRALAKKLEMEGREPSPKEMPDAMYFAMRFRRWYRAHPITLVKRLEVA